MDDLCIRDGKPVELRATAVSDVIPALLGEPIDLICGNKFNSPESCMSTSGEKMAQLLQIIDAKELPQLEYGAAYSLFKFLLVLQKM